MPKLIARRTEHAPTVCRTITMLIFACLLLMQCTLLTSQDPCAAHAGGCRVSFGLDVAFEDLFTPMCNTHFVCYACGGDYGYTKADCDSALLDTMHQACTSLSNTEQCTIQAGNLYSITTRVVGSSFFHSPGHTELWCIEHFVPDCLPSIQGSTHSVILN